MKDEFIKHVLFKKKEAQRLAASNVSYTMPGCSAPSCDPCTDHDQAASSQITLGCTCNVPPCQLSGTEPRSGKRWVANEGCEFPSLSDNQMSGWPVRDASSRPSWMTKVMVLMTSPLQNARKYLKIRSQNSSLI